MFTNLISITAFVIALVAAGKIVIDRFPKKIFNRLAKQRNPFAMKALAVGMVKLAASVLCDCRRGVAGDLMVLHPARKQS